ncbi:replication initiation protein [Alkalibacillus haloalkaliphilus]|uniref:replication initiation protein n=1 Tax=Alkalibacillus haloalkaliphilus TaxID=94136 RepID=UPI00293566D9|nr:replication initiation protein [Alkalibacillus haloalkaliphilus]MDV2583476.1 replication initiation protein [Alkalibacillus haloalkaliphilus]
MNSEHLVTKSNNLIEARHRHSLTTREQKIILTAVSMIQPDDDDFKTYEIEIREFHNLLGLEGREYYTQTKEVIRGLMSKVIEIPRKDGGWLICNWASHVEYIEGQGRIEFGFDPKLKPYLLQLKQAFTSYRLSNILSLKSAYAIRLYELMKKWQYLGKWKVSVDQLKEMLGIPKEKYKQYGHLKSRVINYAIQELNTKTDIKVSFEEVRKSRRVDKLIFTISHFQSKELQVEQKRGSDISQDLLQELNQLSKGYEINFDAFNRLSRMATSVFGDKKDEELKHLTRMINQRIELYQDIKNPVGLMIHLLTEKEKLRKEGIYVQGFEQEDLSSSSEVLPKWFKEPQESKEFESTTLTGQELKELEDFFHKNK